MNTDILFAKWTTLSGTNAPEGRSFYYWDRVGSRADFKGCFAA